MQVVLRSKSQRPLSLDIVFSPTKVLRRVLSPLGTVEVGDIAAQDDVVRNPTVMDLVARGLVSVEVTSESTDLPAHILPTAHLNVGNLGVPALGVVGTPTPAAMAYFGQYGVSESCFLSEVEVHLIVDGGAGGSITFEFYRQRAGEMTLLTTVTHLFGGGSFQETVAEFAEDDPLAHLVGGDYLFTQCVGVVNLGAADGLTLDFHFRH